MQALSRCAPHRPASNASVVPRPVRISSRQDYVYRASYSRQSQASDLSKYVGGPNPSLEIKRPGAIKDFRAKPYIELPKNAPHPTLLALEDLTYHTSQIAQKALDKVQFLERENVALHKEINELKNAILSQEGVQIIHK